MHVCNMTDFNSISLTHDLLYKLQLHDLLKLEAFRNEVGRAAAIYRDRRYIAIFWGAFRDTNVRGNRRKSTVIDGNKSNLLRFSICN